MGSCIDSGGQKEMYTLIFRNLGVGQVGGEYHRDEAKTTIRRRIEKGFTKSGESLVSCDHDSNECHHQLY